MSSLPHSVRAVFTPGIFWSPNGGERYSPYPGSTCSEQISQEIQVQDAYASLLLLVRQNDWFTSVDLKDAYFHIPIYPHPRKVSEIRFPGDLLRVSRAPFWPVSEPEGVCAVHGSGNSPAEMAGHPLGHISRRLAAAGTVGARGQGAHTYSHTTPIRLRFRDKRGKEHAVSRAGYNLSGIIPGLGDFHGAPLGGTSENFQGVSRAFSSRQICSIQIVSSVTRADGVCHPRSPSRPAPYEGIPALGGLMRAESAGHTGLHQGVAPLASPVISDTRGAHGLRPVQEGGHYGRQPDGLGRNSRGPICEGLLEC